MYTVCAHTINMTDNTNFDALLEDELASLLLCMQIILRVIRKAIQHIIQNLNISQAVEKILYRNGATVNLLLRKLWTPHAMPISC